MRLRALLNILLAFLFLFEKRSRWRIKKSFPPVSHLINTCKASSPIFGTCMCEASISHFPFFYSGECSTVRGTAISIKKHSLSLLIPIEGLQKTETSHRFTHVWSDIYPKNKREPKNGISVRISCQNPHYHWYSFHSSHFFVSISFFPCSTSSDITPSPVYIYSYGTQTPHPPSSKKLSADSIWPNPFLLPSSFGETTTVPPYGEIFIEVSLFSSLLTTVKKIQPHPHPVSYVSPHLPQLQKKCPLQFTVHDFPFHVQASYVYYFEHDAT